MPRVAAALRTCPRSLAPAGTCVLALLVATCGGGKAQPSAGPSGSVHLSAQARASTAAHANAAAASLCAQFTLTAYSFDAQGKPVQAAAPVPFTTSSSSNLTDAILGCVVDASNTYAYTAAPGSDAPTGMYNWAYLVSARDFVYCDGTPIPPSTTVAAAPAYFAPVECTQGVDTRLSIDYPVALSGVDSAGYVDMSAGVSPSEVSIGCKRADAQADGIHFGEVGFYTPNLPANDTNAPPGFTSIGGQWQDGASASPPSGADVVQWDGILTDAAAAQRASFYTGVFNPPAAGAQQTGVWTLLQGFAQACPAGTYEATRVPLCETTIDASGGVPTVATRTLLADIMLIHPDAAAPGQQDWVIASSQPSPTTHQLTQIVIRSGVGGALSNPYPTTSTAWNAETLHQTLDLAALPGGPFSLDGLYLDPHTPGGLVAIFSDAASTYTAAISIDPVHGRWALDSRSPLPLLADYSDVAALLAPIHSGCQTPRGNR